MQACSSLFSYRCPSSLSTLASPSWRCSSPSPQHPAPAPHTALRRNTPPAHRLRNCLRIRTLCSLLCIHLRIFRTTLHHLRQIGLAFFVPGVVGVVSKDVLEPLLIGKSTALQPMALMLSIMIWGSVILPHDTLSHPAHTLTPCTSLTCPLHPRVPLYVSLARSHAHRPSFPFPSPPLAPARRSGG